MNFHAKVLIFKKSNLLLILICILSFIAFYLLVNNTYYDQDSYSIGADSSTYYRIAQQYDYGSLRLLTIKQNLIGPLIVLYMLQSNTYLVYFVNLLMFVIAYACIINNFTLDRIKLIVLIAINPMIFISIILVNKEMFGLFSMAMLACYLESKKTIFLIFSFPFAIMTRWQEVLVMVVYFVLVSGLNPLRRNRTLTLIVMIVLISLVYPLFLSSIFGDIVYNETLERQLSTTFGIIQILNELQDKFLFIVALLPKMLSNLFGNVFRIKDYIWSPDLIDTYDIYNSFIVLGHQFAMLTVISLLFIKKKISMHSDLIYFSSIYLILFSISIMVQYRYIFPIYILLCIELAKKRLPIQSGRFQSIHGMAK